MISRVTVKLDPSVRDLCRRPYPGHSRGCPNAGKKFGCPPAAPPLGELLDLSRKVYAVWVDFDLAAHRRRMLAKHPDWSDRQANCCLYWQRTADGQLADHILDLLRNGLRQIIPPPIKTVFCPEACGVDMTATMLTAGIALEWPPVETVRKIKLIGTSAKPHI
jgi:predicted metal-binding protein